MFFGAPPSDLQVDLSKTPLAGMPSAFDPLFWRTYNLFAVPPHETQYAAARGLGSVAANLQSLLPLLVSSINLAPSNLSTLGSATLRNLLQSPLTVGSEFLQRLRTTPLVSETEQRLLRQALQYGTVTGLPPDIRQRLDRLTQSVESQTKSLTETMKSAFLGDLDELMRRQRQQLAEQAAAAGLLSSGAHLTATNRLLEAMGREAASQLAALERQAFEATLPLRQQALQTEASFLSQQMGQRPEWLRMALTIAMTPYERLREMAQVAPNLEMAIRTAMLQPAVTALEQGMRERAMGLETLRSATSLADTLRSMFMSSAAIGETMRSYAENALQRAYEDWLRRQEIFQNLPFQRLLALMQILEPKTFMPQFQPPLADQLSQLMWLLMLPSVYRQPKQA